MQGKGEWVSLGRGREGRIQGRGRGCVQGRREWVCRGEESGAVLAIGR